ncbi:MAG: dihydrolipoyl dehydrogenase [Deltaproteobacteria bacterium]|nr:dihydrolipoyl dehydrogenase [Deltaproteobacteria bacterium]
MNDTPPRTVDVLVIGAGTAGLNARRAAEVAGKSALLVDPGPFGTTCARIGCMPSKLLIAAAEAAHTARHAEGFGVRVPTVQIDGAAVFARVRSERDRFAGFIVRDALEHEAEGRLLRGRARFVGPGEAEVTADDGSVTPIRFTAAVVATGSSPFLPPPLRGLAAYPEGPLLDNETIFELDHVPQRALVVGAGVIGVELGQALARLGAAVTVVGIGGEIVGIQDAAVREAAVAIFATELDLHLDSPIASVEARPEGGVVARFTDRDGQSRQEVFDVVLGAAGRRPNLGGLGLDAAGVALDAHGRPTALDRQTLQLGETPIFLAGDVNELHPLLHEAADDGRGAGQNAARFPDVAVIPRSTPIGVVFSDPNVAFVGQRVRDLDPGRVCMGEASFASQGRARVMRQNRGLIRLWADRESGVLLAAEGVGPRLEHMAHLLAWAVQQRMTVEVALSMPFYHPVLEEGLRTALRELRRNLRRAPPLGQPCECITPGC